MVISFPRYSNTPDIDFSNKTVIHTTTAGTKGLINVGRADEIITGSFVNVQAVVDYVSAREPEQVSLVCMGKAGKEITDEDTLCAGYIKALLENKPHDFQKIKEYLRNYESARKFFDPEKDWTPERDFELCLSLDKFLFVIKAEICADNLIYLKEIK